MKIILSTGLGRLYLIDSAESLAAIGLRLNVIQGWVPRFLPNFAIDFIGSFVGSNRLSAGMEKRKLKNININKICRCTLADFFSQFLFILSRFNLIGNSRAAKIGWSYFGFSSKKYLKNADIFHVRSGGGRGGAIKLAKRRGMAVIVDHSIAHPGFMEDTLRQEYENHGLSECLGPKDLFWSTVLMDCIDADVLLVNSQFVKDTFIANGFPSKKIAVIYTGVRRDFNGLKLNYDINKKIEILFTGTFGIRKGAQYLIPALEMLSDDGYDFRLTVIGTNLEARNIIKNSRIKDHINCIGHLPQDQLKKYFVNSDMYVFPSLVEGCASSGMEAMSAGLPVITTIESGLPINNGEDGLIIKSKSSEEIKNAIIKMAIDRDLRQKIGTSSSLKIKNFYLWNNYAYNIKKLYESVLYNHK